MKKLIILPILAVMTVLSSTAFADISPRLTAMKKLFSQAKPPAADKLSFTSSYYCSEISDRDVINPFLVTFKKTGAAIVSQFTSGEFVSSDDAIVFVPVAGEWQGFFRKTGDTSFLRIMEDGSIIAEFGSYDPAETEFKSSIDPNLNIKAYVTCS